MELNSILTKAETSSFYRGLLNFALWWKIPFNSPHKLKITKVSSDSLTITAPYIRKNKNHLNGIHACCLATICEYVCGMSLVRELDPKKFRIIMKELQMTYHYQAKMDVEVVFSLPKSEIEIIQKELTNVDAVLRNYTIDVFDKDKNAICTANVKWQIKPWNKTKTIL